MKVCKIVFPLDNIEDFRNLFKDYTKQVDEKLNLLEGKVSKIYLGINYGKFGSYYLDIGYFVKKENCKEEYKEWADIIEELEHDIIVINSYFLSLKEADSLLEQFLNKATNIIELLKNKELNCIVEITAETNQNKEKLTEI